MVNRPVTTEQLYLSEILGELRAIRKVLTPPVSKQAEGLFDDDPEIRLREQKRKRDGAKAFGRGER